MKQPLNLSINNKNEPIDRSKHSNSVPTTMTSGASDKSPTTESAKPKGCDVLLAEPEINGHANGFENNQFAPYSAQEYVSPLQEMQNIANFPESHPDMGMAAATPLNVLPCITQEQFDNYSNINTDDLVQTNKKVQIRQIRLLNNNFLTNGTGLYNAVWLNQFYSAQTIPLSVGQ